MINAYASTILRERLKRFCADLAPGCVFYVTRNGEPFADGSFGWARRPGKTPEQAANTVSWSPNDVRISFGTVVLRRLCEALESVF